MSDPYRTPAARLSAGDEVVLVYKRNGVIQEAGPVVCRVKWPNGLVTTESIDEIEVVPSRGGSDG